MNKLSYEDWLLEQQLVARFLNEPLTPEEIAIQYHLYEKRWLEQQPPKDY